MMFPRENLKIVSKVQCFPERDLRRLPQFLRASFGMAKDTLGTPPAHPWNAMDPLNPLRDFLDAAVRDNQRRGHNFKYISIDSRVHMLMPGMYPCIPGWHCDDFWRPDDGQPDLEGAPESIHYCMVLGDCSLTRFLAQPLELDLAKRPADKTLYGWAHEQIEYVVPWPKEVIDVQPGEVWRFNQLVWHKGMPATKRGWRYFIRLTLSHHWKPLNELRTQTQVYLTEPFAGW